MKKLTALCVASFVILLFNSCAILPKSMEAPKVELKQVRVDSISITGARLVFDLDAYNPNSDQLIVRSVKYNLELNNKPVTNGEIQDPIELKGKETSKLSIPISVEFDQIFQSFVAALQKPNSQYKISGVARIGILDIPFNHSGFVSWKK